MKAAVLGFGTVGREVYSMLQSAPGMEAGPVLVRPGKKDAPYKVDCIEDILQDKTIDAIVEAIGGVEPAGSWVKAALKAGKHVVTANKTMMAAYGVELNQLAREHHVALLFSAACGGGVPYFQNLALAAVSDTVYTVGGIFNGTTNYILDAMQRRHLSYEEALSSAQQLGYAEADPTADVSGFDALQKIILTCAVAYGKLPTKGLCCYGIDHLHADDVAYFQRKHRVCRLMAKAGMCEQNRLYAYVEPVLLSETAPECTILLNQNMTCYEAQYAGTVSLSGQGAGGAPTASAILRDLYHIHDGAMNMLPEHCQSIEANNGRCRHAYYLRIPRCFASRFPMQIEEEENGICRGMTEVMSVPQMHESAQKLLAEGHSIFFAAIDGQLKG